MWVCKNCGEKHEDSFDSCWKCGYKLGVDFPPTENDTESKPSEQISFDERLRDLNWPALAFPVIWCFFHRLYLDGLLALIPIVNIFVRLYLLFKGNRFDWEKNKDRGAEAYFRRRRRWNRVTAIIFICLLITGVFVAAYEGLTGAFSWKQYSFESGNLLVKLPLELKKSTPSALGSEIAYGQSYQAGNDRLNITLSYTELKAEYEFDLEQMFRYSLEALKGTKDIKVVGHKYEEFGHSHYHGGKMTVEYITDGTKCTSEYVYILVGNNKCWYLLNAYKTGDNRSKDDLPPENRSRG